MEKFKVGDRVKIRKDSRRYGCGINNPLCVGTIKSLDDDLLDDDLYFNICVDWDDGTENLYNYYDLESVNVCNGASIDRVFVDDFHYGTSIPQTLDLKEHHKMCPGILQTALDHLRYIKEEKKSLTTNNKAKMSKLQEIKAKKYFTDKKLEELSSLVELAEDSCESLGSTYIYLHRLFDKIEDTASDLDGAVEVNDIDSSKQLEKELKGIIEEYNSIGLDKLKIIDEE